MAYQGSPLNFQQYQSFFLKVYPKYYFVGFRDMLINAVLYIKVLAIFQAISYSALITYIYGGDHTKYEQFQA